MTGTHRRRILLAAGALVVCWTLGGLLIRLNVSELTLWIVASLLVVAYIATARLPR